MNDIKHVVFSVLKRLKRHEINYEIVNSVSSFDVRNIHLTCNKSNKTKDGYLWYPSKYRFQGDWSNILYMSDECRVWNILRGQNIQHRISIINGNIYAYSTNGQLVFLKETNNAWKYLIRVAQDNR